MLPVGFLEPAWSVVPGVGVASEKAGGVMGQKMEPMGSDPVNGFGCTLRGTGWPFYYFVLFCVSILLFSALTFVNSC